VTAQTNENRIKILDNLATLLKHAIEIRDIVSAKRHACDSLEIISEIESTWEAHRSSLVPPFDTSTGEKSPELESLPPGAQVMSSAQDWLPGEGDDLEI